jgi:DNA-binding CsgD family transcriptional regulator
MGERALEGGGDSEDPSGRRADGPGHPLCNDRSRVAPRVALEDRIREEEMHTLREPRFVLEDLIESLYGPPIDRAHPSDAPLPRLRLKDWRVIEELSVGPDDYVLLRRVKVDNAGVDSLTARERDAVRYACTGASNKEIAYRMGISPSTVGVLLWRASRKFGATDRDGLIRIFGTRRPG